MIFSKSLRILITAGPTWVPIDAVRVITSRFSGETGLHIARHLQEMGATIDLLMGPGRAKITPKDKINLSIENFFFYDQLDKLLEEKISINEYDVIIHSSAVADYTPDKYYDGKISSQDESLTIKLKSTEKLIDKIKKLAPNSFLIKFKLQVGLSKDELLDIAHQSLQGSDANLIVANDLTQMTDKQHIAYIMQPDKLYTQVNDKKNLCQELSRAIELYYK